MHGSSAALDLRALEVGVCPLPPSRLMQKNPQLTHSCLENAYAGYVRSIIDRHVLLCRDVGLDVPDILFHANEEASLAQVPLPNVLKHRVKRDQIGAGNGTKQKHDVQNRRDQPETHTHNPAGIPPSYSPATGGSQRH